MNAAPASFSLSRSIVLTGMMGAGKSSIGRKLAQRLGLSFVDSDVEIESAAGMSVAQFFERYGEPEFRKGERRVIARLLEGAPLVLSTGGGAFMDADTRALIRSQAIAVWLRVDVETLLRRTARRDDRPLLKSGDPREVMERLLGQRESIYAEADIVIDCDDRPVDENAERVAEALEGFARKAQTVG
jgi:shikimate kinase